MPSGTSARLRRELVQALREQGHLRDDRVAAAFEAVPRELFLAEHAQRHGLAAVYRDEAVVTRRDAAGTPLSSSSQPAIMARMLEMLGVRPGQRVLEIGAGTGYNAALLAHLVGDEGTVVSVDLDADTAVAARRALLSAGAPARVEVGDGARGWPPGAPYDAVIATASTEAVPRAWFDQLRPGGRLVVPLRLSTVVFWLQAVVAFRKGANGFESTAATGGGFMALRPGPDVDQAAARPARLVAGEVADPRRDRVLLEIAGPALAGLDRPDRQRLITTALGFGRTRDLPLRGASPHALMTWVALALPEHRQVEVSRGGPRSTTARQALGVVDVADGSLALLVPAATPGGGVRLVAHGGRGAERAVLAAVERWHLAGRPGIGDARFTIRYGAVRPHGWHSARRGDQWLVLDWPAPRRPGSPPVSGPVAGARADAAR
ncbi:MAG TPA: methyltransferase domain-containing protein [Acidimicrobiales bacterium]|nr:methyltransferase domain-containing protein [Acidimicrobiales bacterium]